MCFDVSVADGEDPGDVEPPVADFTDSIWSTDEVPVRDGPLHIVWPARRDETEEPVSRAPFLTVLDEPVEPAHVPKEWNPRSRWLIGGGVLVALTLAVGVPVGMMVHSGGGDETAAPNTTTAETTSPPTTTGLVTTTTTTTGTFDGRAAAETAVGVASVTPIELVLPPAVEAIGAPTEIVVLTVDGYVHTVSVPSGRVRSVAVADLVDKMSFGGGSVVVAPEATAIAQADGSALVIVPRTGPPVSVGVDEFRGGDVVPLIAAHAASSGFGLTTPDGTWIVIDAGGSYDVDASGTSRRIDSGIVQAAARDHRLVRECDDALRCSTVLVRSSDGERRVIDPDLLPDDFNSMTYGMSLSPDGSAVSLVRSGPTEQQRVIIDLDAGEVAAAPTSTWSAGSTWAADSSGVFEALTDGPGLRFIARTGETVAFGEGLGQVVALGVRWPDAELVPSVTVVSQTVSPARPLGPTGITLVGAMTSGGMTYIDIDAGGGQSWATTEQLGRDLTLIKSSDAMLAFGDADEPAFAFRKGVQEPLDQVFASDGPKLPGPIDGTIWVPAPELKATSRGVVYRLVTSDGLPVDSAGATIDLPDAELLGSDGRGGLVVGRAGDVFAVGVDGADRLTSGELVAIGADIAYVRECADIDTCEVSRVERRTGDRSTPDGGFDPEYLRVASSPVGAALGTSVSPDGDVLLVELPVASTDLSGDTPAVDGWFLADTARGRLTFIDGFNGDQPVVWSADSNFAAVLADSTLLVFDRATGELVPLSAPRLRAMGSATSPSLAASTD